MDLKGEIQKSTIPFGELLRPFLLIDRTHRNKIINDIETLSNTIKLLDIVQFIEFLIKKFCSGIHEAFIPNRKYSEA
jgi:hypothetical protein